MSPQHKSLASLCRGLPEEVVKKIGKTKQTRGAQPYNRVVYQNRVNRNGLAVVPYAFRDRLHPDGFEKGHVYMVRPQEYFSSASIVREDFDSSVVVGENAFVYYDTRKFYEQYPPLTDWVARERGGPGEVVYRLPATTATDPSRSRERVEGDPQGIRFFEYASTDTVYMTCIQLAMLAWHTQGVHEARTDGQSSGVPKTLLDESTRLGLWDVARLEALGVIHEGKTVCPLCREPLRIEQLQSRVEQAEGREVLDLTITEVNLFHMRDLMPGEYNHEVYSLGWGHHHCNAVARDAGVEPTLRWMVEVLERNGYSVEPPSSQSST